MPDLLNVRPRRSTEEPSIFPAELGCTFISHQRTCASRAHVLIKHNLPCFLQPQKLLKLNRAHAGDGTEVLSESGRAHVSGFCQILHAHLFREVPPYPVHSLGDLLCRTSGVQQVPKMCSVWPV